MDTKSLAKSKRAHTLHHSKKKHNPHQVSKASPAVGDQKPTREKLPSNWDRYGEQLDLGSEESSTSQAIEVVLPKSKGGDFAHLISEAKSQPRSNYCSDVSLLVSDVLDDFGGFGPLLSEKGQNMFSWIADNSFEFEDKMSTNVEVPFLSLDLKALAEQLSKVKLAERLFIEPELLPLDVLDDELQSCGKEQQHELVSSASAITGNISVPTSEEGLNPTKQIKDKTVLQSQGTVSNRIVDSAAGSPFVFEAASAEAELDMLLDSFTEVKILESLPTGIPSVAAASTVNVKKEMDVMKATMVPANIATGIGNPLEERSDLTKIDGPSSKSKLQDDFDSWLDTI